jgi:hypothetical protein
MHRRGFYKANIHLKKEVMFKILKQELLFIPLMLMLVEFSRRTIVAFYPETALFDRGSELETFIFRLWQITWITSACWLLLRVVFPPGFKSLINFYNKFEKFDSEFRENTALKIFLVFFLSLVYLVGRGQTSQDLLRKHLLDTLHSQLCVREATGNNDGVEVEKYLKFVGRNKGDAWCAAYVSTNLHYMGIEKPLNPVSAWAPSFANPKYVISSQVLRKSGKSKPVRPGDVFTLFYVNLNRVGHAAFIISESGQYYITNEGNTGTSGSREGSGVHSLKRSKIKVYAIADYITPYLNQYEKITLFTSDCDFSFLSSKAYGFSYIKGIRKARQHLCTERFDLVPRYGIGGERIFCADRSDHPGGSPGRDQSSGDHNGERAVKGQRFDYIWKAYSQMCLQRPGTKGSASGSAHTGNVFKSEGKAKGRNYLQDKGSPLYT